MPLVIIIEFETESVIKGYNVYMNHWTLIIRRKLGNNLARPEPENKVDKYAVAVTKDAQVIGQLKKGRIGRYAKTVFFFLLANPMNIASITVTWKRVNFRDGQDFQIPWTILFKAKEKYIEIKKKNSWTYTLYNRLYAWNIVSKG